MPPKKSVTGRTPYNITFQRPDGTFGAWLRYAPNIWKATTEGRAVLVREYGEKARLVKVKPYVEPEPPDPAEGNPFAVGDILEYSWGYDQTNVDFYQVTRTTDKTIWLCEIKADAEETGFMCGKTVPRPGQFVGKELRKKVQFYRQGPYVKFPHGYAEKWDGFAKAFSTYA